VTSHIGYTAIHTEGGLLPVDLLSRVAAGDTTVGGLSPGDYHLAPGERISEQITRAWSRLLPAWRRFAADLESLPVDDPAAGVTRERWLQPLFHELGQGRLLPTKALEVEGKAYPISHMWGHVPIHLVGVGTSLDRRQAGVRGAATASPHSMVQELLNRSDDHLWALLSNGRQLRVLRDNASLTRQAYLEFDVETIFGNEIFDEFVVLWLVCHESRLAASDPRETWLERWVAEAASAGTRALDALRGQVELAITHLGRGFIAFPDNQLLRKRLREGDLGTLDYYRQVLRLVYRLIFILVAEDRGLLFAPASSEAAQRHYIDHYSMARLRGLAAGRSSRGPHPDLWRSLGVVMRGLSNFDGCQPLALPSLGSFLWSDETVPDLDGADISDTDLLAAVRALTLIVDREAKLVRPIDYRNLGPDELGGVYEGLLELHPSVDIDASAFELESVTGSERKSTGSYYTPESLIAGLLDSALEPLLVEAVKAPAPEAAILALRVLDPAVGSGHFLAAAGRRIARRLASVRTGEPEPAPETIRHALRDVVGRCLYGIDLNPMALELAKINLWLEAIEPGRPLTFLDHHLACGNALLGATPKMIAGPIPNEAYQALSDDAREVATTWRRTNANEVRLIESGQQGLALGSPLERLVSSLSEEAAALADLPDETTELVEAKAAAHAALVGSEEMTRARLAADAWCASFLCPKREGVPPVTTSTVAALAEGAVDPAVLSVIDRLRERHRILHWHLAFPDVFRQDGGFSLVIGNPPWDQLQYDPREIFANSHPEIAEAPTMAKRNRLIAELAETDPPAFAAHRENLRDMEAFQQFIHSSGRFPLTSFGRLNTAPLFVEAMREGLASTGRLGVIVPTGIATDSFNQYFFADLVSNHQLVSLFDFENSQPLFPGVHRSFKFCLLTLNGSRGGTEDIEFAFFAHKISDLSDPERRFSLTPDDLELLNPNTRTASVFRSRTDAELTKKVYRRVPVVDRDGDSDGNPWGIEFQLMFMMNTDSDLFRTRAELDAMGAELQGNVWRRGLESWLPLYEGKMVHHFTHRWGDYSMQRDGRTDTQLPDVPETLLADPNYVVQPRYWVEEGEVHERIPSPVKWFLGFRDITNTTNERTMIASAIPVTAVGNNEPLIFTSAAPRLTCVLPAILDAFVFDYFVRHKVGGTHLNFYIAKQLPLLPPTVLEERAPWSPSESVSEWMIPRVLELTYTAADMVGFATDLDYDGPPFSWNPERRRQIRAELDAACFHLYGLDREELQYVMDTFPIVRGNDEGVHGEFLTKRLVLEQYDILSRA
jgi:hypothetical protein